MSTLARRLGLVAAVAMTSPAMAHAEDKRDPVAADYLFREARKAARAGDYTKACPLFADSLKLDPGAGALMNLADCEEHIGRVASAWEHWREALDALTGKGDKRGALAKRRMNALDKRLPRLTLRLESGAPSDVKVERDGIDIGASSLGLPVPVDPGMHSVVVHAQKHEDRAYTITLREAQLVEQSVGAGRETRDKVATSPSSPAPVEDAPALAPPPPGGGAARTIGFALVGVGVVGIGVGAVAGFIALDKKNTVQQHCQSDPAGGVACADQTGLDAAASGKTMSTVSTVGFAAGAASAAIGALLLLTSGGKTSGAATAIAPRIVPGGAGLSFARTF